jgi:hypothetical protein
VALTTYAGLKTSIASWLHRSDLTAVIPDFVDLAESDIAQDLHVRAMETVATGTLTGETLAFPTGFQEARSLSVDDNLHEYASPDLYYSSKQASSQAYIYTIQGQNFYILNGASGDSYQLTYSAMFAALTDATDTNWLLTNHPDVYLYGSLRRGCEYTMDDAGAQKWLLLYHAAVQKVRLADKKAAYSGRLTVRPDTVGSNP